MWYQVNGAIREVVAVGAWGPAIFSDDVAADIREDWRLHIGDGLSPEAATTRIIEQYADAVKDQDEAGVVWLALAVSQWRTGRLLPEVQARAIEVIDNGADLRRWESADPKTRRARAQVLAKTRDQLLSPPPETKRIPRRRRSRTPYGAGDVLRYDLRVQGDSQTASATLPGASFEVTRVGNDTYLRADEGGLKMLSAPTRVQRAAAGRWLDVPPGGCEISSWPLHDRQHRGTVGKVSQPY